MAAPSSCNQLPFIGFCVVISIAIWPTTVVSKGVFLGTIDRHQSLAAANSGQSTLLFELELAIGRDHRFATERRVDRLEEAMRPMFNALPKDQAGRLGPSGVRYMLQRLFVQRHGWYVNGLGNMGDAWNISSPAALIGTHVGQNAQGVFDNQLHTDGFDLHHAAVLAATLENFVHIEAVERLEAAYNIVGLSPEDSNATEAMVAQAMKTYTLMYVLQKNYSNATQKWAKVAFKHIHDIYPTWNDTVNFLEEIRKSVVEQSLDLTGTIPLSWDMTLKILETFGERYGHWQNRECMSMKRKLTEMEDPNTGRVRLSRFYGGGADDKDWIFWESVPYLRNLGALDETDPTSMSVIIPNYMNGANNCVAGSKFYDVCCIDECDALVSHLEHHVVASEASPERILELVAALPSDTMTAPRTLSDVLSQRLEEIANHHGGSVPLHGRLFAQWMHHAYPRECMYPRVSSQQDISMTPVEFLNSGGEPLITPEQLKEQKNLFEISKSTGINGVSEERSLPWTSEEELFVCRPEMTENSVKDSAWYAFGGRTVLMLLCAGAFVHARLHPSGKSGRMAAPGDASLHKYYV